MRLLVLIKVNKYVGWENLMALKVIRLYLNNMRYVIGTQIIFWRKGVTWLQSKNNSAKGILNLLEFSHIIFTYTIE